MLTRAQSRTPVLLLFVLNAIALLFTMGGLAYTVLSGYVGMQMEASTTWACSNYATYKLENNRTKVLDAVFFAAIVAFIAEILLLVQLIYLLVKLCKDEHQNFEELTQSALIRLYIGFSVAILGLLVGFGYYATYIVEQGIACFSSILLVWLIIGAMFILAFILQLICWIYLFIFKSKVNEKFEQPKEQQQNIMPMEPPPKGGETLQQPVGMMDLFRDMLINNNKQNGPDELKEPLIVEVDEEDKYSEPGECKEKLVHMTYEDYKRKQEEQYKKELEREELQQMKKKIQQEEQEKKQQEEAEKQLKIIQMKKKISQMALSPNDANFDDIFLQSENEQEKEKKRLEQQKKEEEKIKSARKSQNKQDPKKELNYPANYVPKNEEDRKKYEQFKRKQRENEKASKKEDYYTRHPQNIGGGRSKKVMKRLLHHFKRPHRDEEIYKRHPDQIKEQQKSEDSYISSDSEDRKSATFSRTKIDQPPPPPSPKNIVSTPKSKKSQPDQLYFHKEKSKSPIRKKLFQQGQTSYMGDMNFGSILGTLVKGAIETERHDRLKMLKQKRQMSKPKKNEKLIDFIRSRYE